MIQEEDVRFKNLEKKIGAFAAVALAGLVVVLALISLDKDLFTQKYQLKFTVDKGSGFSRGMPVKLSGFRIGRIKSIALNDLAKVDIYIEIDKKYQKWIRSDSTAKLTKEGLVGDSVIEVSVGSPAQPILKDSSIIAYEKTKGLEELANEIGDKVKPVLIEVRDIIGYVNNPDGDIKQSLRNIKDLTHDLQHTRQNADNLLNGGRSDIKRVADAGVNVLDETRERVRSLQPTLEKVDATLAEVNRQLPPLLDKVGTNLSQLEITTRELGRMSEKTMPRLPSVVNRADDTLESTDTLMKAIQDMWPFKSHVPVPNDRELVPGDSYE